MVIKMTRREALALVGLSVAELANELGITPNAIYLWNSEKIPLGREYQILDLAQGKKPILKDSA